MEATELEAEETLKTSESVGATTSLWPKGQARSYCLRDKAELKLEAGAWPNTSLARSPSIIITLADYPFQLEANEFYDLHMVYVGSH